MRDAKLVRLIVATVAMVIFSACTTTSPIKEAETFEQKSFALYGTYVIFQGKASELVQSPEVSERVKEALREADRLSYPRAEALVDAAIEVGRVKELLERCPEAVEPDPDCIPTQEQRLTNAITNLSTVYLDAKPVLLNLVSAVKGAK